MGEVHNQISWCAAIIECAGWLGYETAGKRIERRACFGRQNDKVERREILLKIWQEASQHVDLDETVRRIASLVEQCIDLAAVVVRRIDGQRYFLETVASAGCCGRSAPHHDRSELDAAQMQAVIDWASENQVWHRKAKDQPANSPGDLGVGFDAGIDVIGLAVTHHDKPAAIALFLSEKGDVFDSYRIELLSELHQPLQVAYENAHRFRELSVLREATEAENRKLVSKLGRIESPEILGARWGLREVLEKVSLVAPSDVPVLLLGETGSGKEVIARAIHDQSPRSHGPFLRVNCGAIPPELVDSELFGHEKGSFTGAVTQRKGWFERADQGTLLLDECGELTLAAQVRLLRILQEGSFERVGGEREINVDVRVIAATHKDLKEMVREGRFREDLWYRLAVFPIAIPPLRERRQDISEMAAQFALQAARRLGFPPLVPTDEDLVHLAAHSWPGNVRELKGVMERALILGGGRELRVAQALADSSMQSSTAPSRNDHPESVKTSPHVRVGGRFETLDEAMARHIRKALEITHGRIEGRGGAAHLLGINPHTLRGRMRKLGIDWKQYRPPDEDFRDPGAGI